MDFCVAVDDFGEAFTYNGKWSSGSHTFDDIADGDVALSCTDQPLCVIVDDSNNAVVDANDTWSAPYRLKVPAATLIDVSCADRRGTGGTGGTGGARCLAIDARGAYLVGHGPSGT